MKKDNILIAVSIVAIISFVFSLLALSMNMVNDTGEHNRIGMAEERIGEIESELNTGYASGLSNRIKRVEDKLEDLRESWWTTFEPVDSKEIKVDCKVDGIYEIFTIDEYPKYNDSCEASMEDERKWKLIK